MYITDSIVLKVLLVNGKTVDYEHTYDCANYQLSDRCRKKVYSPQWRQIIINMYLIMTS